MVSTRMASKTDLTRLALTDLTRLASTTAQTTPKELKRLTTAQMASATALATRLASTTTLAACLASIRAHVAGMESKRLT
jgi:hypothetical protein